MLTELCRESRCRSSRHRATGQVRVSFYDSCLTIAVGTVATSEWELGSSSEHIDAECADDEPMVLQEGKFHDCAAEGTAAPSSRGKALFLLRDAPEFIHFWSASWSIFELHFSKFAVLICDIFVMLKFLRGNHSVLVEVWGIILMLMVGSSCLVACVFSLICSQEFPFDSVLIFHVVVTLRLLRCCVFLTVCASVLWCACLCDDCVCLCVCVSCLSFHSFHLTRVASLSSGVSLLSHTHP